MSSHDARVHFHRFGIAEGRSCGEGFVPRSLESFLRSSDSNCSAALRADDLPITLPPLQPHNDTAVHSLRLLNVGSGTTGTSFLFAAACDYLKLRGVHWTKTCGYGDGGNASDLIALHEWWNNITYCSSSPKRRTPLPRRSDRCRSAFLLDRLRESVRDVFRRVDVLMDTPVDVIYAEIAPNISSNTVVLLSVRDPEEWLRQRWKVHVEIVIMCRPEMLHLPGVRHPFDLPGCLRHSEIAIDAISHVYDRARIIEGYQKMNAYNARLTSRLHVMCLWDSLTAGPRARAELILLWKHFNSTRRSNSTRSSLLTW